MTWFGEAFRGCGLSDSTVLLVEDDPNDVLLVQRAFRRAAIANPLEVATDGEQAVAYLSGEGAFQDRERYPLPRLVLLDLKLPRLSGLEVLKWIRSHPTLRKLLVVVLTSSREHTDVDRAYGEYVNSYLVKPVSPDDMLEMTRALGLYWLRFNQPPAIDTP